MLFFNYMYSIVAIPVKFYPDDIERIMALYKKKREDKIKLE